MFRQINHNATIAREAADDDRTEPNCVPTSTWQLAANLIFYKLRRCAYVCDFVGVFARTSLILLTKRFTHTLSNTNRVKINTYTCSLFTKITNESETNQFLLSNSPSTENVQNIYFFHFFHIRIRWNCSRKKLVFRLKWISFDKSFGKKANRIEAAFNSKIKSREKRFRL